MTEVNMIWLIFEYLARTFNTNVSKIIAHMKILNAHAEHDVHIEQHVHPSFLSFTSVYFSFVDAFRYFLLSSLDFVDLSVFD